jgi:hypothetical protein
MSAGPFYLLSVARSRASSYSRMMGIGAIVFLFPVEPSVA